MWWLDTKLTDAASAKTKQSLTMPDFPIRKVFNELASQTHKTNDLDDELKIQTY